MIAMRREKETERRLRGERGKVKERERERDRDEEVVLRTLFPILPIVFDGYLIFYVVY
jgi:hypothetical protein